MITLHNPEKYDQRKSQLKPSIYYGSHPEHSKDFPLNDTLLSIWNSKYTDALLNKTLLRINELNGRACSEDVMDISYNKRSVASGFLNELWKMGYLLKHKRKGKQNVSFFTPERALIGILRKSGNKIDVDIIKDKFSKCAYNDIIEEDIMNAIITSAEKLYGDIKRDGNSVYFDEK
jgi:hypothetical protein